MAELVRGLPATEEQLVAAGEQALPTLIHAVRREPDAARRGHAARTLARVHRATAEPLAVEAYVEGVLAAPTPAVRMSLLEHAHRFPDPDGHVMATLRTVLGKSEGVTREVVQSAASMTEIEAIEPMMQYVGGTRERPEAPGRDIAMRYLGRAARKGRMEIVDFFTRLADACVPALRTMIEEEMRAVAGGVTVRNWRGWYLANARRRRWEWLADAAAYTLGKPFDPSDVAHVSRLIEAADREPEPAFALLEPLLARRFGFVPPRDVFDPEADLPAAADAAAAAVATLKAWWKENAPYSWYDAKTGRWEVNEDARSARTPVDPKTGELVPPQPPK